MRNILKNLEDPNRPLIGPNYWFLMKMGLILPKSRFKKAMHILLHEMVTLFVITQYMDLYVIRSDLEAVITNLKISMISIICVVKSNTFVFWQKEWKKVIDYVTEADKEERAHSDPVKVKIIDTYTKYCRRVSYFHWFLTFMTFLTVTLTPFVLYLTSSNHYQEYKNETRPFPHVFSAWVPYDREQFPWNWLTVFYQGSFCGYGAAVMGAYDSSAIVIIVGFSGKLQLLRERSKQMLGSGGKGVSDEEAGKEIKYLHNAHVLLTEHSRLFNSLLSPVMFLYVVVCSLVICASAYQLTSATDATQIILMSEHFIFSVIQLFLFTWHSNEILLKSQELALGPYESEWWAANVRQRKSVLLLAGQFRIRYIIKAGPFNDLTVSTFITILKGAYSYYTLLRD